ncbi:MAG: GNAT family N-acetyltransferase [Hyphomicrobiaceae bacterium]
MSVAIRQARAEDLPAVHAMMRDFAEHLNAIDEPEEVSAEAIARIDGFAFGPDAFATILVAEAAGAGLAEPAGYLTYFWGLSMEGVAPALFVGDLYVAAAHRGGGVGRALMARAREIAAARGAEQVNWTVWRKNTAAQAFYDRIGGRVYEEEILMTLAVDAGEEAGP